MNTPKTIEDLVKEFGNKLAFKLNPSNDTMEAIRLLRKELPELLAEQDRISKDGVISQIHKAPIWKLVPNTPRMIMCSDTELKDFLQTLTNKE